MMILNNVFKFAYKYIYVNIMFYEFILLVIVIFFYVHINFHLNTNNELDVIKINKRIKKKELDDITSLKQPSAFYHNNLIDYLLHWILVEHESPLLIYIYQMRNLVFYIC